MKAFEMSQFIAIIQSSILITSLAFSGVALSNAHFQTAETTLDSCLINEWVECISNVNERVYKSPSSKSLKARAEPSQDVLIKGDKFIRSIHNN